MNITMRQLEVFCAIASHGNVTRASEELLLSQSAASMALAEFERWVGQRLFNRRGRKLLLNEQGQVLWPLAREVLTRGDEIEHLFTGPDAGLSGSLRIGASSTIGNYLVPTFLGEFAQKLPEVELSLEVGNTDHVIRSLLEFKADVGYIEGLCRHPKIEVRPWRVDQLIIVASPQHPLARRKRVTCKDLSQQQWILRESGSGTREIFERSLAAKLDHLHIGFELGNTEAVKQAVRHNLGITCLSQLTVADALDRGSLVQLKTPWLDLQRDLYCLLHRDHYSSRLLRAVVDFFEASP